MKQHHTLAEDLRQLMQQSGQKGLTLLCPLHPANPDRSTDRLTLKHLAQDANKLIQRHWSKSEAQTMTQLLEQSLDQLDLVHVPKAVGIYLNPTFHRVEQFHFSVPPEVIVDSRFPVRESLWRNQLAAIYYVLSLSEKALVLYEVSNGDWTEVQDHFFPHQFRDEFEYATPVRSSSYAGSAHVKMYERDKLEMQHLRLEEEFNLTDEPLTPYLLHGEQFVLAGADRDLALFRHVSRHADRIIGQISGNYQAGHQEMFRDKVHHLIQDHAQAKMNAAITDFFEKWGSGLARCGLADCWHAVEAGQGLKLLVERGYRTSSYRSPSGQFSESDQTFGSVFMPDAVDELMERTIRKGGHVLLVDNNTLSTAQRVGLILRYPNHTHR